MTEMNKNEPTISVVDADKGKKRIDVEVPAETVTSVLDRSFRTLSQRVRLRGFRPGKIPRAVLERMYGQQVRDEVVEELVQETYNLALARHQIFAATAPEIVVQPLDATSVLRFSATVDVYPEVVVNCEGIEVARPTIRVEEQDIERVLARLRDAAATLHPVTDRDRVEAADVVTADIAATIDGRPVAGIRRKDALVEAGQGSFPGALEERLVGLTRGTTATVEVDYPADYPNPEFAGKRVAFTVAVTVINRREVPPLDDDFARTQGKCPSLAALRERIRSDLDRDAERRTAAAVREALVNALIERHPFDLPDAMVERRCDTLIESLDIRVPPGPDGQKALATLRQELRPRAIRDGKTAILLDRLAAQQGLEVGDDDVVARMKRVAEPAGTSRSRADERRRALRVQMLREKALAFVAERSTIRPAEDG